MSDDQGKPEGALPGLKDKPVLGAPVARVRAKSNVSKLFVVLGMTAGVLFVVSGIAWAVSAHMAKKKDSAAPAATTTGGARAPMRNSAVRSTSIEQTKAELAAKERREAAAASAAAASPGGGSWGSLGRGAASAPGRSLADYDAQESGGGRRQGAAVATAAKSAASAPPKPLTLEERQLQGEVLLVSAVDAGAGAGLGRVVSTEGAGPTHTAIGAGSPGSAFNTSLPGKSGDEDGLASRLKATVLDARAAGRLPNMDYLLEAGKTHIPCVMVNGINTTLPGIVNCQVMSDVYSANGKTLLVERGANVMGQRKDALKQGQAVTFVLWTRLDTPFGPFALVDSPATDQMGYNGVAVDVDTHFWERFGGAIMLSVIDDAMAALVAKESGQSNSGTTYNSTTQTAQSMASEALRNTINIPPTGWAKPAKIVYIELARDVDFSNVYSDRR